MILAGSDDHEADRDDDADRGRLVPGPGGPDEDRRGGFERGGWVAPLFDDEIGRFVTAVFEQCVRDRRQSE